MPDSTLKQRKPVESLTSDTKQDLRPTKSEAKGVNKSRYLGPFIAFTVSVASLLYIFSSQTLPSFYAESSLTFKSPASIGFSKRVSLADLKDPRFLSYTPEPECSAHQYGEDATFVSTRAIGVGDGVGGWAGKPGADPAFVSKHLMQFTCQEIHSNKTAVKALADGYDKTTRLMEEKNLKGATTATVGSIVGDDLEVAHVGDSALMVVRDGKVMYKTTEQTFMFNGPLQLGTHSDTQVLRDAEDRKMKLEVGDIVIAASDGVIDNMFPKEILECIADGDTELEIAKKIAHKSRLYSEDQQRLSPFAKGAQEAGYSYQGGKVDDVSVVVGKVERRTRAESPWKQILAPFF